MRGTVIRTAGSSYTVRTNGGEEVECSVRGNFRLRGIRTTNPVAIGDDVEITAGTGGKGMITAVGDRRNYIIRRSTNLSKQSQILAANIDLVLLFVTVARPETYPAFIDRFLASAEAYRVPVALVFNKIDSYSPEETGQMLDMSGVYERIGYEVHRISALQPISESIKSLLCNRITLLAGNSGVGKSTFVNALVPDANAKTAGISESHLTGMHTTTDSRMYHLPAGGDIIDIPGIKGFGSFDMQREEISHYFREIFARGRECRFANCTHTSEPGCAVKQAVENGNIALSRYTSYLGMLDDVNESKYRQAH